MAKLGKHIPLTLGLGLIAIGLYLLALVLSPLAVVIGIAAGALLSWLMVRHWKTRLQKPDEVVGPPTKPQIRRWFVFRSKRLQIVLHHHLRSDPPVMHDHSWHNWTLVLKGHATEWRPPSPAVIAHLQQNEAEIRRTLPAGVDVRLENACEGIDLEPGRWIARKPTDLHWYQLDGGTDLWTLFITGREVREWGHVIDGKWRAWWKCENLDRMRID